MPARTDTSFTVREDGFDHLKVGYRSIKDIEAYPEGMVFDIECEEEGINLEMSIDGAQELAEAMLALVKEAKSRSAPKPTTKPKK